jgi:hypothetical protein
MTIRFKVRALLTVALLLATIGSAYSQQPVAQTSAEVEAQQKALSFSFVSPNTRENLTLAQALRLLNSREERNLINNIRRLSGCLQLKPFVRKTIGSSTDGAEHSALFRVFTDQQTLRYMDARLGKSARQKSVLFFRQGDSGAAKMYVLRLRLGRRNLTSISRTLDRNGVAFRTLVPSDGRRLLIYVVDLNNELPEKIVSAARNLGALTTTIKGTAEFIGDDADRDKAQQVFAGVIKQFEDENPGVARRCSR